MKTQERKELSPSAGEKDKNANKHSVSMKERTTIETEAERRFREAFDLRRDWKEGPLPAIVTTDDVCKHCDPKGFSDITKSGKQHKGRVDPDRYLYKWCSEHQVWECILCQHWIQLLLSSAHGEGSHKIDWDKAQPILDDALTIIIEKATL